MCLDMSRRNYAESCLKECSYAEEQVQTNLEIENQGDHVDLDLYGTRSQ